MTPNKEHYLKEIYKLGGVEKFVGNKRISKALGIAPASVSEMLGKLSSEGLIEYEPYKGSRLTKSGLRVAISILRGHHLWEVFLIRHLGYSWSEALEDACLLEHTIPTRLAERLDAYLNYPTHCPHGNIIPTVNGQIKYSPLQTLDQLSAGELSHIRMVEEKTELLEYLQNIDIKIGQCFKVIDKGAYEGPITLDIDGRRIQISYKAACQIYVDETLQP